MLYNLCTYSLISTPNITGYLTSGPATVSINNSIVSNQSIPVTTDTTDNNNTDKQQNNSLATMTHSPTQTLPIQLKIPHVHLIRHI